MTGQVFKAQKSWQVQATASVAQTRAHDGGLPVMWVTQQPVLCCYVGALLGGSGLYNAAEQALVLKCW